MATKKIPLNKRKTKCKICNKEISAWPPAIAKHMKTHGVENKEKKEFKCPTCGKQFEKQHQLAGHMRVHYKTTRIARMDKCPVCGVGVERFSSRKCFANHCRKHIKNPSMRNPLYPRPPRRTKSKPKEPKDVALPMSIVIDDSCSEEHIVEIPIVIRIALAVDIERK